MNNYKIEITKTFCLVECPCDDPNCNKKGINDCETGHIINCPCQSCHNYYSKVITRK